MSEQGFGEPRSEKLHGTPEEILREVLPFVREAYMKAQKKIAEGAIKPESFLPQHDPEDNAKYDPHDPPYDQEVVKADIEWAEEMNQQFLKTLDIDKIHADIIEAILYEHIEQSNWFGDGVRTIKTSRYDDLKNGVDLIVEFDEGMDQFTHMGLAVDVTFGETKLRSKIEKIKEEIAAGELAHIRYFESERSHHKGVYQNLPRVVIGVDRSHLIELARMWVDDARKKEFATHPVQKLILHQVAQQLMSFSRFAEECGKYEIANIYRKQLALIQRRLAQKQDIDAARYEEADGVGRSIKRQLELF
ncbi:MAG: hypothetical protein WAU28_01530 [Candidatus Moraniibacteriota bacterium]